MLFNRFFKQPKPNKFGYTPVYYDERKIERERKIKEAQLEEGEYLRSESFDFKSKYAKEVEMKRNQSLNRKNESQTIFRKYRKSSSKYFSDATFYYFKIET